MPCTFDRLVNVKVELVDKLVSPVMYVGNHVQSGGLKKLKGQKKYILHLLNIFLKLKQVLHHYVEGIPKVTSSQGVPKKVHRDLPVDHQGCAGRLHDMPLKYISKYPKNRSQEACL